MVHTFFADIRNKLAIHAKRVTIQPRDMHLLRDIWNTIDGDCAIGAEDTATKNAKLAALRMEQKRRKKQIARDLVKARRMRALGKPLTKYLRHSLAGQVEFGLGRDS